MSHSSFQSTINAVYEAVTRPELWSSSLEKVAEHVGGSGALLAHHDLARNKGTLIVGRLREDLSDVYVQRYCINPYSQAIGAQHIGTAVQANALTDERLVRRTAFHADIVAPQKIADMLILPLRPLTRRSTVGGISVMLNKRQADFTRGRLRRLQQLAPHLTQAINLAAELDRARAATARFDTLLQGLPMAAVIVDRTGKIVDMNVSAERALSESETLRVNSDLQLRALRPGDNLRLAAALAQALGSMAGEYNGFQEAIDIVSSGSFSSDRLILTPLPPAAAPLFDLREASRIVLIQIISSKSIAEEKSARLASTFGLTRTEARIVTLFAYGRSSAEAAEAMDVSINTVKTHLKHCYEKIGVHSQVALMRLLSTL